MPGHTHPTTAARTESPRRVVVVATLAVFWATLLLALGVPGAGPILVAALGGSAMVALRRLLGGRLPAVHVPSLPRIPVRPALVRGARLAGRVRLPRRPHLPPGTASRVARAAHSGVESVRARAAVASVRTRRVRAVEAPSPEGGRAGEAWEFCRLGAQLRQQGRLAAAVESFETAVWIFRDLDDPRGLALALNGLGLALVRQRRLDVAVTCYREAAAILDRLGDAHAQGQVLANLGTALRTLGRSDEARASWEDALTHLEPGSAEYARIRELRAVS
jgi:hypothetical protein